MHRHLTHHLVLIAALLYISPAIFVFCKSADLHQSVVLEHGFTPRSYHSLLRRANDPESDGEEEPASSLGPCVPRYVQSKSTRRTNGANVKRSNVSSNASCLRNFSSCSKIETRKTSDNSTNPLQKRARPLPGFGSNNDLRTKTQQQLSDWMMQRIPDPRRVKSDVEMLWNQRDDQQWIDLKTHRGEEGESKAYAIPTSLFREPGDDAFAWGTIALVGCTMYIVIKTPTPQDTDSGVYMAHIWESPGFEKHVENSRTWILAQKTAWIKDFISKGFPQPDYGRWVPVQDRIFETNFQEGLNKLGAHLKDGHVIVMHPRKYELDETGGVDHYVEGDGPQHPDGLNLLKTTVNNVMRSKHQSTLTWLPDYLYLPNREDEKHERAWTTPSGRTLFEYDPHFDLGNGQTTRMGMLLLEDGGPRGPQKADGTYEPGPGGPFFFNFG